MNTVTAFVASLFRAKNPPKNSEFDFFFVFGYMDIQKRQPDLNQKSDCL